MATQPKRKIDPPEDEVVYDPPVALVRAAESGVEATCVIDGLTPDETRRATHFLQFQFARLMVKLNLVDKYKVRVNATKGR